MLIRVVGLKYHYYNLVRDKIKQGTRLKIRQATFKNDIGIGVFYENYLIGHVAKQYKDMCNYVSEVEVKSIEKIFLCQPYISCEIIN